MESITAWLERLELERDAQLFADNDVDLDALRPLGEGDVSKPSSDKPEFRAGPRPIETGRHRH
jgi:hypothetical protein